MLVDASAGTKKLAFDHEKLAAAISSCFRHTLHALALPFAPAPAGRGGGGGGRGAGPAPGALTFSDNNQSIQFGAAGFMWKCTLTNYTCVKGAALPQAPVAVGGGAPFVNENPEDSLLAAPEVPGGEPKDGLEYEGFQQFPQQGGGGAGGPGRGQTGCAPRVQAQSRGKAEADAVVRGGGAPPATTASTPETPVCTSFDGKWEALIQNYNVFLRPAGTTQAATPLSYDGSEGNYYTLRSVAWSPDSKKLVAYHTRPGYDRQVHYVESSPTNQLQPKHSSIPYRKPGDALDIAFPALFDIESRKQTDIDHTLFPNPYNLTPPVWWKDSRGFTFEYNQRGHQVYRVIEVDARTAGTRAIIDERTTTFFYYNLLGPGLSAAGVSARM
jgi:hypothetical protein